jgi:release factor glutamine methyltransferase
MHEVYEPAEDSHLLANVLKRSFSSKDSDLKFLEIGCGSGIQIKTLLELGIKKENIFCCDINPDAVKRCSELGVSCFVSDLFEKAEGKFDVIIFNPPYLPVDEREPESSRLATTGGKDGGEIANKFLRQAKKYLNDNGVIFLLTSSLTQDVDFDNYEMDLIAKKKLFFEELYVWKLTR